MNIDQTIAELELKHLIESLLELEIKDKRFYVYDPIIEDWSDKNIGRFMELLDCIGFDDPSFCCISLWAAKRTWTKFVSYTVTIKDIEIPVDIVYCFKLENGKMIIAELKIDKNGEIISSKRIDDHFSDFQYAFFKMLYIAFNDNLLLNKPEVLEQHPFMEKMLAMFNNC